MVSFLRIDRDGLDMNIDGVPGNGEEFGGSQFGLKLDFGIPTLMPSPEGDAECYRGTLLLSAQA